MIDLQFAQAHLVHLIWLVLLVLIAFYFARQRAHQSANQLVSKRLQPALVQRTIWSRRMLQLTAIALMCVAGVLALMRPQTPGLAAQSSGRVQADVMVVLDLSKSMLAEDAAPNRLERAKSEIIELSTQLSGYRLGLVGFAGRASVLCPLTTDIGFFSLALSNADPSSITRGGTRIGEAIRTAVKAFGPGQAPRLMLLITDGEDHDSYPKEAATAAKELGIHIVSIGFGSEQGSQITITDPQTGAKSSLRDRDGQVVLSKLDGETLRELALMTDGAYVPAGTAALDLESIVGAHITPMVLADSVDSNDVQPEEHYAFFTLLSLLGLFFAAWTGASPVISGRKQ